VRAFVRECVRACVIACVYVYSLYSSTGLVAPYPPRGVRAVTQ